MQFLSQALGTPRNCRVLYVDMNGFFASIEQQDHPNLVGKPVAVVSHLHPRATVLASSYEAKALGITTGTKMEEAQRLAPGIACLEPRPGRYREVHRQIMQILITLCGPEVQPRSIDEAAVYLASNWQNATTAHALALAIKEQFRQQLGPHIRCSIGIAPNSLLAKLATNLKKPDGLVEITLENTWEILGTIPLTALPGIAERMALKLEKKDILTPQMLYATSPEILRDYFGIWGRYWWWRLHGYECDSNNSSLKSMSHEHVLSTWIRDKPTLELTLAKMADRLVHRLEHNHLQCRGIFLSLRLSGAPRFTAERVFDAPTFQHPALLKDFMSLLNTVPLRLPYAVRKISIGFNGLVSQEQGIQLMLEEDAVKGTRVSTALEIIRDRFGYESIQCASTLALGKNVAREQLGFGRIRDS